MAGSAVVYAGLVLGFAGLLAVLRRNWRRRGFAAIVIGILLFACGLFLPAPESRVRTPQARIDEFTPVWQFHEVHSTRVAAPPAHVFEAIKQVRADEILLFRTLTWIRRGGKPLPEGILNPGGEVPLITIATRSGFVGLADDPPRELVIGTVVVAPPGTRGTLTPEVFQRRLPPGFALATMNFHVQPDARGGSLLTTETRVFANSPEARRRFAVYWRVIYPGSAIIRRMWLRAIEKRAEQR